MVSLNKKMMLIILILVAMNNLKAETIKYFFAEVASESSYYKYKNTYSCIFELDSDELKFKDTPKIELGNINIQDINTSRYCKQFYQKTKLHKLEVFETTPYLPTVNSIKKPNNFKELKVLKRFKYNNEEQVILKDDFTTKIQIKYYYYKHLIEIHTYDNGQLIGIEKNYYENDLLIRGKIYLTEGMLEESNILLKSKVFYSSKKKVIKFSIYSYGKGVKTCSYDKDGNLTDASNTFKEWDIVEDKNGTKYPKNKKVICPMFSNFHSTISEINITN